MDIELEERVEALEFMLREKATEAMATDLVIRALIGIHPDPKLVGMVLQNLLAERLEHLRDIGFEKGYLPATAQATADSVKRSAHAWIRLCGVEPEAG